MYGSAIYQNEFYCFADWDLPGHQNLLIRSYSQSANPKDSCARLLIAES